MSLFRNYLPTDEEIISGLLSGISNKSKYETQLFNKYKKFILDAKRKHKLTEEDCVSIYSDTIIVVLNNIQKGSFEGRSELKTYIYKIFSNKCVDQIRKNATNKESVHNGFELIPDLPLADESKSIIQKLMLKNEVEFLYHKLSAIGEKCKVMILLWGEGYSDAEIAQKLEYNSSSVAKTSRLRCLEKLKNRI